VGYSTAQQANVGIARAIMRFDLTSIPAGTYIKSASLQPYLTGDIWSTGQSNLMAVTAFRINQLWPGSPTWNNFANAYAESYGSATIGITFGRSNIDVTELVRGWVNGVWPNYGIMLRGQEGGYINLKVFGSANGFPTHWPQLVVEYPDPMAAGSTVTVVIPTEPVEDSDSRSMFESWIPSAGEDVEYERTK